MNDPKPSKRVPFEHLPPAGALPPAITFSQAWTRWGWRIGKKSPKAEGLDDFEPLVDSHDDVETQKSGGLSSTSNLDHLKWSSLALLVVQNSGLFVVTRYSRVKDLDSDEPLYLGTVVVLIVEFCKLLFCLL